MRTWPVPVLACLLCALPAFGLEPYLVKDINPVPEPADSNPAFFDGPGAVALFAADDGITGSELWRSDGTEAGTWQVADTCQPDCSGRPSFFARTDRATFFQAVVNPYYYRLWATDGTPAGTFPLTDRLLIDRSGVKPPKAVLQGVLYFGAEDDDHHLQLWRSDGTPSGTWRVTDFRFGFWDSRLLSIVAFKDSVYFSATDDPVGGALWKTDGTPAGTVLVKDPVPASPTIESPGLLQVVGSRLVFLAPTRARGLELWSSDGTPKGTQVMLDIAPGRASLQLLDASVQGGRLYLVLDDGRKGQELWVTDGTAKGTRALTSLPRKDAFVADQRYSLSLPRAAAGSRFVFRVNDGPHGAEAWVTDGTVKGTRLLKDFCPGACDGVTSIWDPTLPGLVLLAAADATRGLELWATDGTAAGTRLVRDLCPGSCGADPALPLRVRKRMFFTASDGTPNRQLWASDGTASGTVRISDFGPESLLGQGVAVAGQALFAAPGPEGRELWRADGTAGGTRLVRDINRVDLGGSFPGRLMALGGEAVFFAGDFTDSWGPGLWKSDGTGPGTVKIAALNPGQPGTEVSAQAGGRLFFFVQGENAYVPWRTDGTGPGTVPLPAEVPRGNCAGPELRAVGGTVFFPGRDADHGTELWASDGTVGGTGGTGGTRLVRDIEPGGASPELCPEPRELTAFQGRLYFSAYSAGRGRELWRSDGTEAGSVPVRDINPGPASSHPLRLAVHADRLWFLADDGEHGFELWSSDGTEAGTKLALELTPGPESTFPNLLVSLNERRLLVSLPFLGLWVTDGSKAGTRKIAGQSAEQSYGRPPRWAVFEGRLYYVARENKDAPYVLYVSDGSEEGTGPLLDRDGMETAPPDRIEVLGDRLVFTSGFVPTLWESDGTPEGTFQLIPETLPASYSAGLVRAGSHVFFPAYSREDGVELWAVEEDTP
jgi:ELWxxDGT repeat protein